MRFYTGSMFPGEYRNQIFIAEHGSWNRSTPIGYRITVVQLETNKAVSYKPFAEGWLQRGRAWGRPVAVLVMPDGHCSCQTTKQGRYTGSAIKSKPGQAGSTDSTGNF